MRFLIAPDSFKGTLPATEVAEAIGRGVRAAGAEAELLPAADGGEGTMDALLEALGGELRTSPVHDPLGRPIEAQFALLEGPGERAVVEVAQASGLSLIGEDERDPEAADTAGSGELIAAAVGAGAKRVLVAAGGSATTDGGAGAIGAIEAAGGLGDASLEVICDVATPFEQAADVFAPQKGADPAAVGRLRDRLVARAGALPRDPRGHPMTGAAGGLAGGLWAAFGARLVPGAAYVLGVLGFDRRLEGLGRDGAVITGEGSLDAQSLEGKLVGEIARRCRAAAAPLHAIAGRIELDSEASERLCLASAQRAGTVAEIEAAATEIAAG
jgi:glycerate kinase